MNYSQLPHNYLPAGIYGYSPLVIKETVSENPCSLNRLKSSVDKLDVAGKKDTFSIDNSPKKQRTKNKQIDKKQSLSRPQSG